MDERLQRRKLEALRRGVHRMSGAPALPVSTHVVGVGAAGAGAVAAMLRAATPGAPKLSALVVDVGDHDLAELRGLAAALPEDAAEIAFVSLDVPDEDTLLAALRSYPQHLAVEYPRYVWGAGYEPWLTAPVTLPAAGGHAARAVAKAIYGVAYYTGARPMERALRAFAASVQEARAQSVIAIVFGLGGGAGGGIAVDLARHLSTRMLGRATLVAGVGVAPCDGDAPKHRGAQLYAALNELDCLGDEAKNRGVVASCGDLFANPFTAGFIVVPQQHAWLATRDLGRTRARTSDEVASFVTGNAGVNLWETLRLLNWVAAPSTQHSAARTPWGAKWVHVLGFADAAGGAIAAGPDLARRMGLRAGYAPEFIEMRASALGPEADACACLLAEAFSPDVPPQVADGARENSIQFILPRAAKADLMAFAVARDAYDAAAMPDRVMAHSMLLEQGVLLSERSTRLEGMAGASLGAGSSWVAVPFDALRGEAGATAREGRAHAA
jgi:hypothetical protein